MKHAGNPERPGFWIVHDQIGKHLPEPHPLVGQIGAPVTDTGIAGDAFKATGDFVQNLPGNARTSFLFVVGLDLLEVLLGV